jgi:hypothetical protein
VATDADFKTAKAAAKAPDWIADVLMNGTVTGLQCMKCKKTRLVPLAASNMPDRFAQKIVAPWAKLHAHS